MPFYNFVCPNNHAQDIMLTFLEQEALQTDENGVKYILCNVKYGDLENPVCGEKAYQTFGSVGFVLSPLKRRD